ncbi:MAG: hypothetical protein A2991_03480 [Candidatus Terrybacteria bacterium RIFCSPLOWO2_01_FULL_58_14]|uniref:DUF3467 domain-containing protein n=2 Tax=Candidatus Terryibacteriota TaxID=1817920 RepID=A0A1G2PVT6_9BACT|nr:MAG: hypothetical protein A2682_00600 [Candidatus Terrybacteria bacterium RIFCSPHIGHO2_01_FULL_58_15]OHA52438.1 MAG: hypothetical protein A2991_03480 [Candidatus Terrybacteria bacterium RIFCSPLOWO2_01_FULL_58_14]
MATQSEQLQVKANDEDLKGRYANAMQVSHDKDEFLLDFLLLKPPLGQLVGRIIVSPAHIKRILRALAENIKRYEEKLGAIEETQGPAGEELGFKVEE